MFKIYTQKKATQIHYAPGEKDCILRGLQDLQRDFIRAGGQQPTLVSGFPSDVSESMIVGCLDNPQFSEYLHSQGICAPQISEKWEHYAIVTIGNNGDALLIAGSDTRGTLFGIYEFSRMFLDMDPLYLWTGRQPEQQPERMISKVSIVDGPKSFRFRGWFINDEDLLEGFSRGGVPEEDYHFHRDYGPVLDMIAETALRLKQNLIIPCSHLDIMDPDEEALIPVITRRGLFVSMHHQEPVGVHHFTVDRYWKERGVESPNYFDEPEKFHQVWNAYIKKWSAHSNVIWQLGLRGRGDRPVWYNASAIPDSPEERGKLISDAVSTQMRMIQQENAGKEILSSTTLWMEGMELYPAGVLEFPKDTKIIFADFGPTQMLDEAYDSAPREAGRDYGLYYHTAFWGCGPHLVQGTPLEKIYANYFRATEKGDCDYSILNVSNFREFVFSIPCVAEITWDIQRFQIDAYRRDWCAWQFRTPHSDVLAEVYRSYYESFFVMQRDRFPKEMLLMDGMCRRVALKLITIMQGKPFVAEDIQNKKLYNFQNPSDFIQYYEQATAEGIARFEAHLQTARAANDYVAPDRREFYKANMLLHTETILGLYRWVHHLCLAAKCQSKDEAGYIHHLHTAVQALEAILAYRNTLCDSKWAHWYDGDMLMDIPNCVELTRCLYSSQASVLPSTDILKSRY